MPIVKAISDTIELIVQEEQRQWSAEIPVLQAGIWCPNASGSRAMRRFNRYYLRPFVSFILRTLALSGSAGGF